MGFWKARARSGKVHLLLGAVLILASGASSASAVTVSLPSNATIGMAGQTAPVDVSVGAVTDIEAFSFSITYDTAIVSIANAADVELTTLATNQGCALGQPGLLSGRVNLGVTCTTGFTGSGALLTITFTGVANGFSALSFSNTPTIPDGCFINEGDPGCDPVNGGITVGPMQPTFTASATATITATATASATATTTASTTATATHTLAATVTDTPTIGPSPTPSQTLTVSSTATVTLTPTASQTASATGSATATSTQSATPTVSATGTVTSTATATPVPTPFITSGAVGGSTRVFGIGAPNIPAPGLQIVAENGNEVIGTGGTTGTGQFFDTLPGIGLTRPLVAGERIFPRDTVNNVTGPVVVVGPQPPTEIPTLDEYGLAVLGTLLGLTLAWQLRRRRFIRRF